MSHNHCHNTVNEKNEKKTLIVIGITLITMVLEVGYGYYTHSMALLADGWHMGTHAIALILTYIAYFLMRFYTNSVIFRQGTVKIPVLAGYTSSLLLSLTGFCVIYESFCRFFNPLSISFNSAILIAVIGLVVNGVCIVIMRDKHENHDYNFKAAYMHILADAMTSVFAIIALLAGKYLGLNFLDPVMGVTGGILILSWSFDLIKDTSAVLLDIRTGLCDKK